MKCARHPRYRAIFKPRVLCARCWLVFFLALCPKCAYPRVVRHTGCDHGVPA